MIQLPRNISQHPHEFSPEPGKALPKWRLELDKMFGKDPEARWGKQLIRVASDMILVCDESLAILHHNRAFLKAVGYHDGSFTGQRLLNFLPSADRREAGEAFDGLRRGHAAGMRFCATMLSVKGHRQIDARAVRSRNYDGTFFYYIVAREVTDLHEQLEQSRASQVDPLFSHLPVAAWRTDEKLRVLEACGTLWNDLGLSRETFVGAELAGSEGAPMPPFLVDIDFCDTMAGMTLHTAVRMNGHHFSVTVEPFLDEAGRIVGTIGVLRRAKAMARNVSLVRTDTQPNMAEAADSARDKTRRISIDHHAIAMASASKTTNLRPRSLAPPTGHVSTRLAVEKAELETVILAG
jgi:PAS domain S-box-containing protein